MKKETVLLIAIAAVAAYLYFGKKVTGSTGTARNQLASLVDSLNESAEYKTYFKSRIPEMTDTEVSELIVYLSGGRQGSSPAIVAVYQKYLLGS